MSCRCRPCLEAKVAELSRRAAFDEDLLAVRTERLDTYVRVVREYVEARDARDACAELKCQCNGSAFAGRTCVGCASWSVASEQVEAALDELYALAKGER